ncbi:MAG: GTP-binding protein [Clostridia bacterium]
MYGKSSLLNKLAKVDRAIVTKIAGTTRDVIEESINIGDLVINIFDTAGIRDTKDEIEKIGVEKSLIKMEEVDLVIHILNVDKKVSEDDKKIISKIQNKGLKSITVINKIDEVQKSIFDTFMEQLSKYTKDNIIQMSIIEEKGIEELLEKIKEIFLNNDISKNNDIIIVNKRHKNLLSKAIKYLENSKDDLKTNKELDILCINIKEATIYLGEIIGEDIKIDIAKEIFSKFCLGK